MIGAGAALVTLFVSACSMTWPWGQSATNERSAHEHADVREASDGTPLMRVRVAREARSAQIGGAERVIVRTDAPVSRERTMRTPLTVSLGSIGWIARSEDGTVATFAGDGAAGAAGEGVPALIVRSDGPDAISLDGVSLPGVLWLHEDREASGSGVFDVVERVPIEAYLPGVVAKELIPGWSAEAFKAQAIAARSYALHERQRRTALGSHFDVESTTQDQAYAGATENERAHESVRATRGLVLTWRGALLRSYYSSTTGGRAASARDTWPTGRGFEFNLAAPIQASARDDADSFSPLFRWTVERGTENLVRRFRAFGRAQGMAIRDVSSLAKIEVAATNSFGRPRTYKITDTGGLSWTLSAESIRLACNFPTPGTPEVTRELRVNSGDFEARVEGERVVFEGRGFGHGVGMSQYGAEGKARRGMTARAILEHYYPGAVIDRAY